MSIFNFKIRKQKQQSEEVSPPKIPHEHVWKDMPWYTKAEHTSNNYQRTTVFSVIEPYICITCGERKDEVLEQHVWKNVDSSFVKKNINALEEQYKDYLKPKAIVEDMIRDILYVKDPHRLQMVERTLGTPHKNCGSSTNSIGENKIEIPKITFNKE